MVETVMRSKGASVHSGKGGARDKTFLCGPHLQEPIASQHLRFMNLSGDSSTEEGNPSACCHCSAVLAPGEQAFNPEVFGRVCVGDGDHFISKAAAQPDIGVSALTPQGACGNIT